MNPLKLTVISLAVVLCAAGGGYLFVNYDNSSLDVSNENICDRKLNYAWTGISEPFISNFPQKLWVPYYPLYP